jgi:hypothetical protein
VFRQGKRPNSSPPLQIVLRRTGVRARLKLRLNKALGRRESGKIFLQPQAGAASLHSSYMDEPSQHEQKLSGKDFKLRNVVEMGLQLTEQVQAMVGSENIKTVVSSVLRLMDSLEPLVRASDLVGSAKARH